MRSIQGLEILFSTVKDKITSKEDALITFIHWFLIKNNYRCVGIGDQWEDSKDEHKSELLPKDWNTNQKIYTLRYVSEDTKERFVFKMVSTATSILVNIMNAKTEKGIAKSISLDKYVSEDFTEFEKAYVDPEGLVIELTNEINPFVKPPEPVPERNSRENVDSFQHNDSRLYIPQTPPLSQNWPTNPLAIGRDDLDPLGGSGSGIGGMLMDPRGLMRFRPPTFPGAGGGHLPRGALPRGAIPPGARFDPFGPPNPNNPRPGSYGAPNPDHLPPPGYDDMFS